MFGSGSAPAFGAGTPVTPQPTAFGVPSTPSFGLNPSQSSQSFLGQTQTQPTPSAFSAMFPSPAGVGQLTTQMAPVAAPATPLPDRDVQTIVDAYKDDLGNPKYSFKHFLFSVSEPSMRSKPLGVCDIMWAEAMNKLEGMDSNDREKLWPELVQGFKDLSRRMKLQDEAIAEDSQRLRATQANVKLLERHFQADTLTWIQRLHHKEQELQRRLLRVMRIVEALEGKGFRMLTTKGEAQVAERLRALVHQLKGPGAELPCRVNTLLSECRRRVQNGETALSFPSVAKIDDQSLFHMHQVLCQQTEAISRLLGILKKDSRDIEIMMTANTERTDEPVDNTYKRTGRNGFHSVYSEDTIRGY
eukprot:TRINITY_DN22162_c0_g1_i1.p1 TRINITY_DN22162_c0_g1~~TRINITY_DN22162_c0_g1_i1.p1  ORF type:complete len:359 (-),score=60.05 TRINITY_DN22162_c0_g1_i1:525-1601(-)